MKKIAIVDCRADNETIYSLESMKFNVIPTLKIEKLYDAIASHSDIQIHYLGNNKFISAPECYEHYKRLLPSECTLLKGNRSLSAEYPYDIPYNVAASDKVVFCKTAFTDSKILNEYKTKEIIDVKQGYSKCNICFVAGNAIITSDNGIARSAERYNVDVLKISDDNIYLKSFSHGFIGGATGLLNKNILAVNGDINSHKNCKEIKAFCKKYNVEIVPLKSGRLSDIGTIIVNL